MSIVDVLLKISPALEAGQSLEKASGWSNVANSTHALVAVLGFLMAAIKLAGYDIPISPDQIYNLAAVIAGIGGTAFTFFSVATNPNAGFVRK